ncbi:MAG: hypothetical protein ACR2IE_01190 [Candidatus Sumerlaeaceae bacterium]
MYRVKLLAALALSVPAAAFALGEAVDVHKTFPYYYTGYYQYGSSPYVVVPNFRTSDTNFATMSSPYYYRNTGSGFYSSPVTRRPWSFGFLSDGYHGTYYF